MAAAFQLTSRAGRRAGHRVVQVEGRLGIDTVPQFLQAVRAEAGPVLILDLAGVPSVDSAGVGALVQTFTAMQKSGRRLGLAQVSERVSNVLQATKVHALFPQFASVNEAEEKLG
jgi:anti-anti-sigma factor